MFSTDYTETGAWRSVKWICFGVFLLYLGLRLLAWLNDPLLEDHDSVIYLHRITTFLSLDWTLIQGLSADMTPFYPALGGLFTWLTGAPETGARLASLAGSAVLFGAVMGLGKRFLPPYALLIGLLLLTFNPLLIRLSYSVLTEPSYLALVYLGLWLFVRQYEQPRLSMAVWTGVLLGLAFLNRVEGILFIAGVPFLQVVHFLAGRWRGPAPAYGGRTLFAWCACFVAAFSLLAVPQILYVSAKMDRLALNGRQVWGQVLNQDDGRSYNEKIYGLHHSPSQINIRYLQEHPQQLAPSAPVQPLRYVKLAYKNFLDLIREALPSLLGWAALAAAALGLLVLLWRRRIYTVFWIVVFMAMGVAGPLLHNVVLRHIAVVAPVLLLLAGLGTAVLAQGLVRLWPRTEAGLRVVYAGPIAGLLVLAQIGLQGPALWRVLRAPDDINSEYRPADMRGFINAVQSAAERRGADRTVVVARKEYLAYFTASRAVSLPYTDYEGLVRYSRLNQVDFVLLEYRLIGEFPFLGAFDTAGAAPDYRLVYQAVDAFGEKMALYEFIPQDTLTP